MMGCFRPYYVLLRKWKIYVLFCCLAEQEIWRTVQLCRVLSSVCTVITLPVRHPPLSVCTLPLCTPGLCLLCCTSSLSLVHCACLSLVSLLSLPVPLTPLLPLRIVGKHCRRNRPILAPLFLFVFLTPSLSLPLLLTHWLNISSHGYFHVWQGSVSPHSEYARAACWLFYSLGSTDLLWWNPAPAHFLVQVPSCSTVSWCKKTTREQL